MNGDFEQRDNDIIVEQNENKQQEQAEAQGDEVKEEAVQEDDATAENSAEPMADGAESPKKSKKLSGKLLGLILAGVAIVGLVAGIICGFAVLNSPRVLTVNSIQNAFGDLFDRDEFAVFSKMSDGGSVEFSYEQDDNSIGGTFYFDDKAFMLKDFELTDEGDKLEAEIFINDAYGYVRCEELLGNNTYGIIRGKTGDAFESSVYCDATSENYIADDNTRKIAAELFEAYDDSVDLELKKDMEKIGKRYGKLLSKLVEKYAIYEECDTQIRDGEKGYGARKITLIIDDYAINKISAELVEELEKDEELRDLIKRIGKSFEDTIAALGILEEGEKLESSFDKLVAEMKEEAEKENISGNELKIELIMSKTTSKLYRMAVISSTGNTEVEAFSIEFGKEGAAKTEEIKLTFAGSTLIYRVEKNDKEEYSARLVREKTFSEDTDTVLMSVEIDKKNKDFELVLGSGEAAVTLEGEVSKRGGIYNLTVDKVKGFEGSEAFGTFKLSINTKARLPKHAGKLGVKNILELSDEEIRDIKKKLEEFGGESTGNPSF